MKLTAAEAEIDSLVRAFVAGDYTDEEFAAALESVLARHGASTSVVKTYPNGIQKIRVTDVNGEVVAEYHQATKS